jgi:hypothetical protein
MRAARVPEATSLAPGGLLRASSESKRQHSYFQPWKDTARQLYL